ncbi:sphingosine kinase [Streptococcus pneumoniae]|nr:sphingosine kinase [Streptococcus pneumoniae]VMA53360.1 sphingosine kinase [Streptococcus pneumoniae]
MKKAMVIINPTSGGEKALDYKEKLENKAKEYFEYVETKITEKALDATHFAEEASREQYDAVVVFGGDGTVNEVISGIDERDYILSQAVRVTSLQNFWKSIKTSMAQLTNWILI